MRHPRPTAPRNRLGPCHSERSEESRSEKLTLRDSCLTSFGFAYGSSERQQAVAEKIRLTPPQGWGNHFESNRRGDRGV